MTGPIYAVCLPGNDRVPGRRLTIRRTAHDHRANLTEAENQEPPAMAQARRALRSADDLIAAGLAPAGDRAALERVAERYAVAITPGLADRFDPADPSDPLGRQFVPDPRELDVSAVETADPIADDAHSPVEGIVHRYPDRVLLKLDACVRGLLPVLLPPRDGRPGRARRAVAAGARGCARLYSRASGNLGGDPDRRRPAGAVATAAEGGRGSNWPRSITSRSSACTPVCRSPRRSG